MLEKETKELVISEELQDIKTNLINNHKKINKLEDKNEELQE